MAMAVTWDRDRTGTQCLCGKRRSLAVTIEYIKDGKTDYRGGRFCYDGHGTEIHFAIPDGAVLTELRVYDLHEPNEVIRVTASPMPEQVSR